MSLPASRWLPAAAAMVGALLFFAAERSGLFSHLDESWYRKVEIRTPATPKNLPPLTLISVKDIGREGWPWPHLDYAILLHSLAPYNPDVLALDLPLQQADTFHEVYQKQLARQLAKFRSVVIASPALPQAGPPSPLPEMPSLSFTGNINALPAYTDAAWPLPAYREKTFHGLTGILPEMKGTVRQLPLVYRFRQSLVPGFVLMTYGRQIGAFWPNCEVHLGKEIILRSYDKTVLAAIPVDEQGCMTLHYPLQSQPYLETEFYSAVLSAEQARNGVTPDFDLNKIRRGIVLVGVEAKEATRMVPTPEGPAPTVTLYARALTQLFSRDFIMKPRPEALFALMLALGVAMSLLGNIADARLALAALVAGLALTVLDGYLVNYFFEIRLPTVAMLAEASACWAMGFAIRAWYDLPALEGEKPAPTSKEPPPSPAPTKA